MTTTKTLAALAAILALTTAAAGYSVPPSNYDSPSEEGVSEGSSLTAAIRETIEAWQNRDEQRLTSLVSPDFGLVFIYQPGAARTMTIAGGISFDKPVPRYLAYLTRITVEGGVRFEELPEFDCDEWEWSKPPGIYCDTLRTDTVLSDIAKFENEYENRGWTAAQIARMEEVERLSHKVVVVSRDGDEDDVTFHLSWLAGRWCLVAIDRDEKCGA